MEYITNRYKYTGPTMLLGEFDSIELRAGDAVGAEVNVNIATITKICRKENDIEVVPSLFVAAKYLKPLRETINFKNDSNGISEKPKEVDYSGIARALGEIRNKEKGFAINGSNIEVGGNHYQTVIQPWDYIYANHLDFDSGNVVKYISRYKAKNGAEDVKKAISYCIHILKTQYGEDYKVEATK